MKKIIVTSLAASINQFLFTIGMLKGQTRITDIPAAFVKHFCPAFLCSRYLNRWRASVVKWRRNLAIVKNREEFPT